MKLLNGENIDAKYKFYVESLTEQIKNRKKYVKLDEENYNHIICDENKFKNYINKKILDLSKENFDKKVITINQTDLDEIMKDNKIINQINSIFWIESQLDINRYDVNGVKSNIILGLLYFCTNLLVQKCNKYEHNVLRFKPHFIPINWYKICLN